MAGRASTPSAIEAYSLDLSRQECGADAQQADRRDCQEGPRWAHCEQRAARERPHDLKTELNCLEHALRPGLLAGLGHPAHLRVEARRAGDREYALDQAKPDEPGH